MTDPAAIARELFESYGAGDRAGFTALLAEDMVGYVTTAEAGADRVEGREAYLGRLPDLLATGGTLTVTQVLGIDEERALTMVEIRAEREGRSLHNFAAFLTRVVDGRVQEIWMVDALPAYSDEFWS